MADTDIAEFLLGVAKTLLILKLGMWLERRRNLKLLREFSSAVDRKTKDG